MSDRILVADQNLDPNLVAAHLDRKDRSVVRPQVEGATALEVETGVVPMTSQDAVLDAASVERKTHVRAPIVEGENAPVVEDDEYRTVGSVHNEPTLRLQLLKTAMPTATAAWAVRSQYGAGVVLGERVKAYRKEPNVSADSDVETLRRDGFEIDNWPWAGVPFYVRTGKHMAQRTTEIAISFKQAPYSAFQDTPVDSLRGLTGGAGHRAEPGNLPAVRGQAPWVCVGPRRREDGFRYDGSPRSRTSDTRR